jgi:hypothetical protein
MPITTKTQHLLAAMLVAFFTFACEEEEDNVPALQVPDSYSSADFANHVAAEAQVTTQLSSLTSDLNSIESDGTPAQLSYPAELEGVTLNSYANKINVWLDEMEKAAGNDFDLQNAPAGEGGILGTRLLDEHGLELEQMVEKGSFGAALYNHALSVLSEPVTEASIDRLVQIYGADPSFNPDESNFSAKYAKRRSDNTAETGYFYDIENNLITAKAAAAAGADYQQDLQTALDAFLINWEESNFATVIFYANATKTLIQNAGDDPVALGNAMHAYGEAVGFTEGWKGLANKQITDAQIDQILALLLAEEGEDPESYRFLREPELLDNMDQIIELIQGIYGFSDEEVANFYVNN